MERETSVARKRLQDAETAMIQQLKERTTATGMSETSFEEMLNAIGDCLSDRASSNHEQDGEDD